jgi:hypothetical protein
MCFSTSDFTPYFAILPRIWHFQPSVTACNPLQESLWQLAVFLPEIQLQAGTVGSQGI